MKKILLILTLSALSISGIYFGTKKYNQIKAKEEWDRLSNQSKIDDSLKQAKLYQITDEFVESLQSTYESYGMLGGQKYTKYTSDGLYKVMPTGRLINVRIEKNVGGNEYETLKNDLKEHYKNNLNVNDVYICGGGTIMIDCRK